jgi:hypothetical protein
MSAEGHDHGHDHEHEHHHIKRSLNIFLVWIIRWLPNNILLQVFSWG